MDKDIERRLEQGAEELGLSLSSDQRAKLLGYMDLLKKWNKTYNLTALKTDEQMLVHHILDSLAVVVPLRERIQSTPQNEGTVQGAIAMPQETVPVQKLSIRLLDVGSGGGLPGVVLAIMNPTWFVTCVDAVEKKTTFITQVAGILGLSNLKSKHTRIEKFEVEPFDVVISRAFASLADFANLSGQLVEQSGHLVAMKGYYLDDEVAELETQSDWQVEQHLPICVPQLDAERCLIYLKRKGNKIG
ncbi:16S rRNA (guanine(527)-N(7))-methyltransferase RsmG [Pelistega europaea]|uniref:Ribosomal RNA small subunit methyltransferase G n=1 Tax=Pelistega europaea TaxID=106147 RepID=A0A7Y4P5I0_9BURK|nr:16S rRNA (guanine(527)-N(7))-methyltransferase RsmG [Pelistega europaea]NOL50536.1 16S rRNA (guanine(527)-N(7))-methyltransferase RsmG [Pelistega europaea]